MFEFKPHSTAVFSEAVLHRHYSGQIDIRMSREDRRTWKVSKKPGEAAEVLPAEVGVPLVSQAERVVQSS